ncbi:MAG TPA: hypothetical protein VMW50_05025 [Dehalococcoidia bacterium]|nr:hypothetical protein [Dehalococcoidia bacterium]
MTRIAIDWSHTKGLTTFDGKKVRTEDREALLLRLQKSSRDGEESRLTVKSMIKLHSPALPMDTGREESNTSLKSNIMLHSLSVILEEGCPTSLLYDLTRIGCQVQLISNRATQDYRVARGIEKTDENDAKIIWELSNNGAKLKTVDLNDRLLQLHSLYNQYCRYQKARVAMQNQKKAYLRHFGDGESNFEIKSKVSFQPSPDAFDTAIDALKTKEKSLLAKLKPLVAGGESNSRVQSIVNLQPPAVKGLGDRIWAGIIVTANPTQFKCLSAYLRFCGLTSDAVESHKYNRHARMLYHMLAEETMKLKDLTFRPIYDKCKADITGKHPDYTKAHIHNGALNRTATMLAKAIFNHCNSDKGVV